MVAAAPARAPHSARAPRPRRVGSVSSADFAAKVLDAETPEPPLAPRPLDRTAPLTAHGSAHSASPRPQRVRPVDAVRLAKSELGLEQARPPKLRLAALPAPDAPSTGPGLNEGFYDFARDVVRPQPNARQFAQYLNDQLVISLHGDPGAGGADVAADGGTFLTGPGGDAESDATVSKEQLAGAEEARGEVLLCIGALERFIGEMTTDSKERSALLGTARRSATSALERLVGVARKHAGATNQVAKAKQEVETMLHQVEQDNEGLRHVVSQMLSTENDHQSKHEEKDSKIIVQEAQLQDARRKLGRLEEELRAVRDEFAAVRDSEYTRRSAVRDAGNSPMMSFATFRMGIDEAPPTSVDLQLDLGAPGPQERIGGFEREVPESSPRGARRTVVSNTPTAAEERQRSMMSRSSMHRAPSTKAQDRDQRDDGPTLLSPGSLMHRPPLVQGRPPSGRSRTSSVAAISRAMSPLSRFDLSPEGFDEDEGAAALWDTRPSPLTTSFPALIPFLDFSGFEAAADADKPPVAPSTAATADKAAAERSDEPYTGNRQINQEHLEKHLVMLQEESQDEKRRAEAIQHAVDTSLERLLVWVQAVHNSLIDTSSDVVAQDARALMTVRQALAWLATHPCREWADPAQHLDRMLDTHEEQIRASLAAARPPDAEREALKRELAQSKVRLEELAEQLLEARASVGGGVGGGGLGAAARAPVRARAMGSMTSPGTMRRGSSTRVMAGAAVAAIADAPPVAASAAPAQQHAAVQCDLLSMGSIGEQMEATASKASAVGSKTNVVAGTTSRAVAGNACASELASATAQASLEIASSAAVDIGSHEADRASDGNGRAQTQTPFSVVASATSATGDVAAAPAPPVLGKGGSALLDTEREAAKLRLLRSPFVEGIDLSVVPMADRQLLRPPLNDEAPAPAAPAPSDEKRLGLKQLHTLAAQFYNEKRADDQRRDKASQPRRELHLIVQEHMRRHHGVRKVVHQKCWQLVEALATHAEADLTCSMLADFLDGTRDVDELSFYLYCGKVLASMSTDAIQAAAAASKPLAGYVPGDRALGVAELMFGDLPKALALVKAEIEKATVQLPSQGSMDDLFASMYPSTQGEGVDGRIAAEQLVRVLLEGWRMSALLLEQSVPSFSWRRVLLAFIQADVVGRGWLDPHEVRDAEVQRLGHRDDNEGLRLMEQTSLGAFVFREVHRCSNGTSGASGYPGGAQSRGIVAARKGKAESAAAEACLQVTQACFNSLEQMLGVYLSWLMHSDQLGDLAVYHSVKSRMYGFRKAAECADGGQSSHNFRCLLLVLLAHQFDVQVQRGGLTAEHLDWELRCLISVLRENWRRGAGSVEAGPDLASELDALDEQG